ncbi:hypothetical protein QTP88_024176 [Uroleucon formosanum]
MYATEILDVEIETSSTIIQPNAVPNVIGKSSPTETLTYRTPLTSGPKDWEMYKPYCFVGRQ